MEALRRFWARSVLNRATLLLSLSLMVCCCGWSSRIVARPAVAALSTLEAPGRGAFAGQGAPAERPRGP